MTIKYKALREALAAVKFIERNGRTLTVVPQELWDNAATPEAVRALLSERDGLIEQHHRDSAKMREYADQRDTFAAAATEAQADRDATREERDRLRAALSLTLCALTGARVLGDYIPANERDAIKSARAALGERNG